MGQMINRLTVIGFTLLVIGTAGLLLGEFALELGRAATLALAGLNGVGLLFLGLRR